MQGEARRTQPRRGAAGGVHAACGAARSGTRVVYDTARTLNARAALKEGLPASAGGWRARRFSGTNNTKYLYSKCNGRGANGGTSRMGDR